MNHPTSKRVALLSTATIAALLLAGCGGDAEAEDPDTNGGGSGSETENGGADAAGSSLGQCEGEPLDGVDLESAVATIESYQEPVEGLVVDEPLPEAPDPDTDVVYLDNETQLAGIYWNFVQEAGERSGVNTQRVSTGTSAQDINAALATVAETQPDIVIAVAIDPAFYMDHLDTLVEQGTTFVTPAIINAEDYGLDDTYGGREVSLENGRVMASAAVAFTCGQESEFVYYRVPELPFTHVILEGLEEYLPELHPDAELRVVDIPVAQMDTTGTDTIVNDLQANPDTAFFMASADQLQIGLSQQMDLAGVEADGIGLSSLPQNIEQIEQGLQQAGYGVDESMFLWLAFDEGLRRHAGLEMNRQDWADINPELSTIITQDNVSEHLGGFSAVENHEDEFATLWNVD